MDLCALDRDEIASVLSHEIVHIVSGHPLKRIMTTKSLSVISNAIRAGGVIGNMAKQTLTSLIESNYSQENELHADYIGVKLMTSAGYDPQASARMLQRLKGTGKKTDSTFSYFSTHPPIEERIHKIKPLLP
jgi:predicted Zn-dependent protease